MRRAAWTVATGALLLTGGRAAAQQPSAAPLVDPIPSHDMFRLDSRLLAEHRVINVHLPASYQTRPDEHYPVVYMPDGGLEEDFPHIVNTLDSLVALGEIRPVIVVGIQNTERRRDLTGPTTLASDSAIAVHVGGSATFRAFIRDELIPVIQQRYRCTEETALVGESLAGFFVVETALLEPGLFRRYIALSPSVWWNGGALVDSAATHLTGLGGRTLFFASADEQQIATGTARLAELFTRSAPRDFSWTYEPRPDLRHDTIFRAVVPHAFARLLH